MSNTAQQCLNDIKHYLEHRFDCACHDEMSFCDCGLDRSMYKWENKALEESCLNDTAPDMLEIIQDILKMESVEGLCECGGSGHCPLCEAGELIAKIGKE